MSIQDANGNLHSNTDGRFTEKTGTRPGGSLSTVDIFRDASQMSWRAMRTAELAAAKRVAEVVLAKYPNAAYVCLDEADLADGFYPHQVQDCEHRKLAEFEDGYLIPADASDGFEPDDDDGGEEIESMCRELPQHPPMEVGAAGYTIAPEFEWLEPATTRTEYGRMDVRLASQIDLTER